MYACPPGTKKPTEFTRTLRKCPRSLTGMAAWYMGVQTDEALSRRPLVELSAFERKEEFRLLQKSS